MAMSLIDYLIGYYKNMAKNKIVKNIKNEKIETGLLIDQYKRKNPNAPMVTLESVKNGHHRRTVGRFSRMSISDYQNFVYECNLFDKRTDREIVEILTAEHPQSYVVLGHGGKFPLKYVKSDRTKYNNGTHANTIPKTKTPCFIIDKNNNRVIDPNWLTLNKPIEKINAPIK